MFNGIRKAIDNIDKCKTKISDIYISIGKLNNKISNTRKDIQSVTFESYTVSNKIDDLTAQVASISSKVDVYVNNVESSIQRLEKKIDKLIEKSTKDDEDNTLDFFKELAALQNNVDVISKTPNVKDFPEPKEVEEVFLKETKIKV